VATYVEAMKRLKLYSNSINPVNNETVGLKLTTCLRTGTYKRKHKKGVFSKLMKLIFKTSISQWSTVFFEKLVVTQLVKKFTAYHILLRNS